MSDSELLVKQMRGEYKVKNEGLQAALTQRHGETARLPRRSARLRGITATSGQPGARDTPAGPTSSVNGWRCWTNQERSWSIIHQPQGSGRM